MFDSGLGLKEDTVKSLNFCIFVVIFVSGLAFFVQTANAQNNRGRYGGYPTVSPYMYLLDRRDSPVDNYNRYVRPQLEMDRALQAQQQEIERANRDFQRFQQDVQKDREKFNNTGNLNSAGGSMQPMLRPSAKPAAGFRNHSHYYPNMRR